VLCWFGRTLGNILTPLPSAFLVLLVSVSPLPSNSPMFGSAGTLLLTALGPHPASVSLLMSSDYGSYVILSLPAPFPGIADRVFLRLPRAFLRLAAFSRTWLLFLNLGWWGYMPPGAFLPCCVPKTHHLGVPIPSGAGPGWVLLRFSL